MAGWGATDLMLLAYSSGWVLVPGAVVGLAYALWKPRSRDEKRSARLPSSSWARSSSGDALRGERRRVRRRRPLPGRYLMTILPLVAPAFCLGHARRAGALVRRDLVARAPSRLGSNPALGLHVRHRTPGLAVPTRALLAREEDRLRQRLARARRGSRSSHCSRRASRSSRGAPPRSRSALPSCSPDGLRRRLRLRRRQRAESAGLPPGRRALGRPRGRGAGDLPPDARRPARARVLADVLEPLDRRRRAPAAREQDRRLPPAARADRRRRLARPERRTIRDRDPDPRATPCSPSSGTPRGSRTRRRSTSGARTERPS